MPTLQGDNKAWIVFGGRIKQPAQYDKFNMKWLPCYLF
jgi:hypothetical protein